MTEHELLLAMVAVDPWGPEDREYGDSTCHYCDSPRRTHDTFASNADDRYEHYSGCVWMAAAAVLDVAHRYPTHTFYVPPPLDPPCPICGFQQQTNEEIIGFYGPDSTGTLDEHHLHLARSAGFATVREWLQSLRRPVSDAMPVVRAPRGGITFASTTIEVSDSWPGEPHGA